jgi:hypothetical protein
MLTFGKRLSIDAHRHGRGVVLHRDATILVGMTIFVHAASERRPRSGNEGRPAVGVAHPPAV